MKLSQLCKVMINPKKPGNLAEINIRIPIRIGFVGLVISIAMALTFHNLGSESEKLNHRRTLEFFAAVLGTSAGITSAFYVGQGIELNARSKKIDRTVAFISRWSDPAFDPIRRAGHEIAGKLSGIAEDRHPDIIQSALDGDLDLKLRVLDALNFLEDVALCVQLEIIDPDVTAEFYRSIMYRYNSTFGLWIERLRREQKNMLLFCHLTDLCSNSKWSEPKKISERSGSPKISV
jgi:Domain of unknown function (DUF4760)